MKLKSLLAVLPLFVLTACSFDNVNSQTKSKTEGNNEKLSYVCDDGNSGFEIKQIDESTYSLKDYSGSTATLKEIVTASGEGYANKEYTLMMKGDEAMLIFTDKNNGKTFTKSGCKLQK